MSAIANTEISVSGIPSWVDLAPYDVIAADTAVQDGIVFLFQETQVDLTASEMAIFRRVAFRIETQEGAERAANFNVTFDPARQSLHLHFIRVVRGGDLLDRTQKDDFHILRREQNMERHILDGRVTASLIIPDIRPGDIVETCYTLSGGDRVQRQFYADWIAFNGPVCEIRVRVRAPAARPLFSRSYGEPAAARIEESGDSVAYCWSVRNPARMEIEPLTPSWQVLSRSLQITQAAHWSEVAGYFHPHYHGGALPEALAAAAARIRGQFPQDAGGRLLAALALVRDRLRYQALAFGDGGFFPRQLDEIWSTGYGDCKDASRTFVALVRLLGIEAVCALVSTRYGPVLDQWLPSPGVFDHCIARVRLDGRVFWIDPTRRAHEPRLEDIANPLFGWALPLVERDGALEEMPPQAARLVLSKKEVVRLGRKRSIPASVEMTFVYESYYADWIRGVIANRGLPLVAKDFETDYRKIWPSLVEAAPLAMEDARAENRVTLKAAYTVPDPWVKEKRLYRFLIDAREFANELSLLRGTGERQHDIYLGLPRIIRRHLVVQMPWRWAVNESHKDIDIAGLSFFKNLSAESGARMEQRQELEIRQPMAPARAAIGYREIVQEMGASALIVRSRALGDWLINWPLGRLTIRWRLVLLLLWLLFVILRIGGR